MRRAVYLVMAAMLASLAPWAHGANAVVQQALQQKLASEFALTKITADKTDIVTPGAVLVLKKDGLLMYSVAASAPATNTYKAGKMSHNLWPKCPVILASVCGSLPDEPAKRTFVAGEKFWVTGLDVQSDAVTFTFYSDPYEDTRYYARLKVAFPKGQEPSADDELKTIAEVVSVQGMENAPDAAPTPPTPAPSPTPIAAPPPITPPPPPIDAPPPAPKEIAAGQTKEQVVAMFGPPQKVVKLPTKEIDVYSDMKVIFVNGKVSDVDLISAQDAPSKSKK